MKRLIILMIAFALPLAAAARLPGSEEELLKPGEDLQKTVDYLLDYVALSECVFIRNGEEHGAKAASDHMKRKYRHNRDKIGTPEDFIRLAATKSTMSGKAYMVRLKDGREVPCSRWLLEALEEYRKSPGDASVDSVICP